MEQQTVFPLDTDQFAAINGVKAQTVRKRLCEFGSYFGVTPRKLASRRLMWPNVQVGAETLEQHEQAA